MKLEAEGQRLQRVLTQETQAGRIGPSSTKRPLIESQLSSRNQLYGHM